MSISKYIKSFRLRTLPLSLSGIFLGSALAFRENSFDIKAWIVFIFAILTTLNLQILANLADEIGDAQHGTDLNQQNREAYGLQAGTITLKEMKICSLIFVCLSIITGTLLVYTSFETLLCWQSAIFLLLGLLAIVGAIKYTVGKHAYGYYGLGDLSVFLFFGLVSTMGSYFLLTHQLTMQVLLSAVAIALPIVGVINLNNIRDMQNDRLHGKRTFASLLGEKGAKTYHTCLIIFMYAIFCYLRSYFVLITSPILIWHIIYIWQNEGKKLDKQMPVLSITTFIIALLVAL